MREGLNLEEDSRRLVFHTYKSVRPYKCISLAKKRVCIFQPYSPPPNWRWNNKTRTILIRGKIRKASQPSHPTPPPHPSIPLPSPRTLPPSHTSLFRKISPKLSRVVRIALRTPHVHQSRCVLHRFILHRLTYAALKTGEAAFGLDAPDVGAAVGCC